MGRDASIEYKILPIPFVLTVPVTAYLSEIGYGISDIHNEHVLYEVPEETGLEEKKL